MAGKEEKINGNMKMLRCRAVGYVGWKKGKEKNRKIELSHVSDFIALEPITNIEASHILHHVRKS